MARFTSKELESLLVRALTSLGFAQAPATALARQTVLAEELGQPVLGVAHLFDYTGGLTDGRINGTAEPTVTRTAPAVFHADGNGGLSQTGFDAAFDDLVAAAKSTGLGLFLSKNTTLSGPIGTFVLRLANEGLVALAATNGSALLAGSGSKKAVFCTNPLAFAAPRKDGFPLLIDQSCSATAYVNIRAAAERGEDIPLGWALDMDGAPTTDPKAALKGALLPFGGARGANLALMVDVLAAGLSGGNWSVDAAPFDKGDICPATGLFVLAINPEPAASGFTGRLKQYLDRLSGTYGVHIPGAAKGRHRHQAAQSGLEIDDGYVAKLEAMIASGT